MKLGTFNFCSQSLNVTLRPFVLSSSVATVGETTGTRLKQDRLPCLFNLYKSKCCTIPPSSLAQARVLVVALVSPSWACSAACGAPPTRTARRRGRSAQGACQRASSQEPHLYVGVLLLLGLHAAHEEAGVHLAAGEVEQLHVLHSGGGLSGTGRLEAAPGHIL